MKFSKKTELILLFVVLTVFINFLFYSYIYTPLSKKKKQTISQISLVNTKILNELNNYNTNMQIFKKIDKVKKEITKTQENLTLLKTKIKTDIQISEIIKSLIIQSGINIHEISLKNKKEENNKKIYYFDVSVSGNLESIVRLLDKIDNKNELLRINAYNIKYEESNYNMNMNISSIYQELNK